MAPSPFLTACKRAEKRERRRELASLWMAKWNSECMQTHISTPEVEVRVLWFYLCVRIRTVLIDVLLTVSAQRTRLDNRVLCPPGRILNDFVV